MPKVSEHDDWDAGVTVIDETNCAEFAAKAYDTFKSAFKRSRKNNLWRTWDGVTVSIFARADSHYGCSIAGDEGPRFSAAGYDTESEAMWALARELQVPGIF